MNQANIFYLNLMIYLKNYQRIANIKMDENQKGKQIKSLTYFLDLFFLM